MPDITMCTDAGCSDRGRCYRYVAIPSEYRQAYFSETPRPDKTVSCAHFTEAGGYGRVMTVDVVDAQYNEKL